MNSRESDTQAPRLSVIVPVYNSARELKQCLEALANADFPDREVIVVDDGSTEPVAALAEAHGFKSIRIDGPQGPASARNAGAKVARGLYLVFIDADVLVHNDTLAWLAKGFEDRPDIAAVIGCYDEFPPEPNFMSQYKNLFHHYVHQRNAGQAPTFWSGCGAIGRELFLRFGGFDDRRYRRPAIEDIELGTWLTAAGHRIVLDDRIRVTHLKHWTLWKMIKSDILDRAVPWTSLILRAGRAPNSLNITTSQRTSVILVYLTALMVIGAIWVPLLWAAAFPLFLAVTALNWDFYRYIALKRGFIFTLRAVPVHWLYFGYCGFSVLWGTLEFFASRESSQ